MPLSRAKKETIVAHMAERIGSAEALVFTHYRGLDVEQISELRGKLRPVGASLHVVKNTLLGRAFERAGREVPDAEMLSGPTAVAVLTEGLSEPAKILLEFAKESEILEVMGGYLGVDPLDSAGVVAMSKLPTREELLGQILGVISGPSRQLVTVLNAPMHDLVSVLQARVRAGGDGAGGVDAAEVAA